MDILVPHMVCVVSEAEFAQANAQGFSEIYIITSAGILKHVRLSRGRHARLKVDSIPNYTLPQPPKPEIEEEINFLPAGKIPYEKLQEIVQFFKDVMNIKKAEQEAMAHILWNETEGYHIGIPDQTVSKASVRYDFDHIKQGDIIVLDIHSHNTMSAFFSGTDDGDDKKGIYYSGVVGKLDNDKPDFKWRFNLNNVKREAKLEEIFDNPPATLSTPTEWLEKVKTGVPYVYKGQVGSQAYSGYSGYHHGYSGGNAWGKYQPVGSTPGQGLGENQVVNQAQNARVGRRIEGEASALAGSGEYIPSQTELDLMEEMFEGYSILMPTGHVPKKAQSPKEANASGVSRFEPEETEEDDVTIEALERGENNYADGSYEYNAIQYGKDAAEGHEQISIHLPDLIDCDELLLDIMKQCYDLLGEPGRSKLATNGF